jgi:hypothetical protein
MTATLALMTNDRGDVQFVQQSRSRAAVVLIVLYTGGGGGYWFVDWCGGRPAPATPASARAWAFYSVLWI